MACHAFAHRVEDDKAVGIRNYGVRPSGGDVLTDAVVRRKALHAASILALDDVGEQLVALHVINKSAAHKVIAHVVPINFFAEREKNLWRAKTHVAVDNVVPERTRAHGHAKTQGCVLRVHTQGFLV